MSEQTPGPNPDSNTPGTPPLTGGEAAPETTPTFATEPPADIPATPSTASEATGSAPGAPVPEPAPPAWGPPQPAAGAAGAPPAAPQWGPQQGAPQGAQPQAPGGWGPAGTPQQQWQPTPSSGSFGQQAAAAAAKVNVPPALQFPPVPATLGWAITGGAAVYLIGLLLPWVSFWGVSVNGLSGGGLFTYLSLLLMIGVVAIGVMIGLGKHMDWFVAAVTIGGGLAGLSTLISFLSIIGTGLASIGPWVSLLGSGVVVGVVVYIWLKLRPATAQPSMPQQGQQPGQWGTPPPPPQQGQQPGQWGTPPPPPQQGQQPGQWGTPPPPPQQPGQ